MNKKKKKGTIKKILASFIALVLVVGLTIVGTLAYLATLSGIEKNTFTGSQGINLDLTEPNFKQNVDPVTNQTGETMAGNYSPSMTIPKDPTLTNSTTGDTAAKEWVAIAVTFEKGDSITDSVYAYDTYANIKGVISPIKFNTAATSNDAGDTAIHMTNSDPSIKAVTGKNTVEGYWIPILEVNNDNKYAIYMYSMPLSVDGKTEPLFKDISILGKDSFTLDGNGNPTLPKFRINVIGAAIKNEYNITVTENATTTTRLVQSYDELATTTMSTTNQQQTVKDNLKEVLNKALKDNYSFAEADLK